MTAINEAVQWIGLILAFCFAYWFVLACLDRWLNMRDKIRELNAMAEEHKRFCLYDGKGPNGSVCHHCQSMACVSQEKIL